MKSIWEGIVIASLLFIAYFMGFDKGVHDGMCVMSREFRAEGKIDAAIPDRACEPWEFLRVNGKDIEPDVHCRTDKQGVVSCVGPVMSTH